MAKVEWPHKNKTIDSTQCSFLSDIDNIFHFAYLQTNL